MAVTKTIEGRRILNKLWQVVVTPYVGGTKGGVQYALDNIVADSTSINQDDPDRQSIDCETRDEAIIEAITLGKYNFTCDNADWQEDILKAVLGWTVDSTNKVVTAPASYKEVWAEIELQFDDPATYSATDSENQYRGSIILPKVLLSSKATMESLKTNTAKMTVAGTAYTGQVQKATFTAAAGSNPAAVTCSNVAGSLAPIYFSKVPHAI